MNMNNETDSIFENFFADVFKSLHQLNEATGRVATSVSSAAESDTRTKRHPVSSFSEEELRLKNDLLSTKNNTTKDHSIMAFLLSEGFFEKLRQIVFDATQATKNFIIVPGSINSKKTIYDYLNFTINDPLNGIKNSDPDKDKKAHDVLAFLWRIAYYNKNIIDQNGNIIGKGEILKKLLSLNETSRDHVPPQSIDNKMFGEKKESKEHLQFNGREFKEKKEKKEKEKTRGSYDILMIFYNYIIRLKDHQDQIISLYDTLKSIQNEAKTGATAAGLTEEDQIEAFSNNDFGSKYMTSDGHIDSEKLYNDLKIIGINIEQLKKCAAFHINLINDEDDGFNANGLLTTAIVDEAPDLSDTNKYIKVLMKNNKNTVDDMLELNNKTKILYDDYTNKIKNILGGFNSIGSGNNFIDMKEAQWKSAAYLMTQPVRSLTDFYSKLAQLWLFLKNEGLSEQLNQSIKTAMDADDDDIIKKRIKLIFDAQENIENELKQKRLIWQNAFLYAQILAYNVDRTTYNTTEFRGKTSSGRVINFTYPTTDIFKTIEDLKIKFAFMVLNNTISNQPRMMNYVQSYTIPMDSASNAARLAYTSALNNNSKNFKNTEFKLKVAKPTFEKFVSYVTDPKNNITHEKKTFPYGSFLNEYKLNSNVIIRFIKDLKKTMIHLLTLPKKEKPIQIIIDTNPGLDRITKVISLINNEFSREGSRNTTTDITFKLDRLLTSEDRKLSNGDDYRPLLQKLIRGVIDFAKDSLQGIYNNKFTERNDLEKAALKKTADAIFGKTSNEIDDFVDYCSNKFRIDTTQDVNCFTVVQNVRLYASSILFEFMTFDFSKYKSISDKNSDVDTPETKSEVDEKFAILKQHLDSNFKRRINKSNIRTLDASQELINMTEGKEFGRVVNTLLRKTLGNTDIWLSAKSAFNEIQHVIQADEIDYIKRMVCEAFSKILNLSDSDKIVSYANVTVSLKPEDFVCILDWQIDGTKMTQQYYHYMQILAYNNSSPPDSAFRGALSAESILKELYLKICKNEFNAVDDYPTKLALKYVVLFYYIMCIGEYFILELNYGKTFYGGSVSMSKKGKKTNRATVGSQTNELVRLPIDRPAISGETVLAHKNSTAGMLPYKDEPEDEGESTTDPVGMREVPF